MNSRSITKSRKLRYGAMAAGFTAVFIAIVIVFNAIFSSLAAKFGWDADMTSEAVFTMSDTSLSYIDDITSDVYIYFASEPDELMADADMRYVYNSAKQISSAIPNVHVE